MWPTWNDVFRYAAIKVVKLWDNRKYIWHMMNSTYNEIVFQRQWQTSAENTIDMFPLVSKTPVGTCVQVFVQYQQRTLWRPIASENWAVSVMKVFKRKITTKGRLVAHYTPVLTESFASSPGQLMLDVKLHLHQWETHKFTFVLHWRTKVGDKW